MTDSNPTRSNADRSDQTRARILEAATTEFSANGLAGARTERIAETAGVNKALLYYYFRNKNDLYRSTLEAVAERISLSSMSLLNRDSSAGERLLRAALNHFDRIYSQPVFQTHIQQEMIRLRNGDANALSPLVDKLFRPMGERMLAAAEEGIGSGELIPVASSHLIYATLGPNVFYFPSALEFRRKAVVEYLGLAIFTDRVHGARLAERVLAETPMPEFTRLRGETDCNAESSNRASQADVNKASEVRQK